MQCIQFTTFVRGFCDVNLILPSQIYVDFWFGLAGFLKPKRPGSGRDFTKNHPGYGIGLKNRPGYGISLKNCPGFGIGMKNRPGSGIRTP